MITGNNLTTFALLLSPLVIIWLFTRRRLPEAAVTAILGAALLLPEGAAIDPPLIPSLDKHSIATMAILLGVWWKGRSHLSKPNPLDGLRTLIAVLIAASIGTTLTNPDSVPIGTGVARALTYHDAISGSIATLLDYAVPFVLGRALFRDPRAMQVLMKGFVAWALLYSLFALVEIRLSPQMHNWVYGYGQHSFAQTMRGGGFRPQVFMQHGLALATFLATTIVMTMGLRGGNRRVWRMPIPIVCAYLYLIMILCKSLGGLVLCTFGLVLCYSASARNQVRVAALLAAFTLAYPFLRFADAFPTQPIAAWAQAIGDADREQSLQFRFDNEDIIMERTRERPLFGWGGFGRGSAFNEYGQEAVIMDSAWIILLSSGGVIATAAIFGLLTFPLLALARRFHTISVASDRTTMAALAVALALSLIDLLINGFFNRFPVYLAGALLGLQEGIPAARALAKARAAAS